MFRFIIENNVVTQMIEHTGSVTADINNAIVICTIEEAKAMLPVLNIDIQIILDYEESLNS